MFIRHRLGGEPDLRFSSAHRSQAFLREWRLHFITASGYHREPLLGTAYRKDLFVKVLEQVRQRYEFVVVGYVVMPEHFHLLISEPARANPSVVIQALKLGVVRRLFPTSRKEHEKWGTLKLFDNPTPTQFWQRRFYDFNVWSAHKHREKLRYIHRNPVKRGLVSLPISGGGALSSLRFLGKLGRSSLMTGLK